jgi:hypothetical protein
MKLFAGRPRDLKDVATLQPTVTELEFVRREIPRLTLIDQGRAARIQSFLDQTDVDDR